MEPSLFPLEAINPISICREVIHELAPMFVAHDQMITLQPRTRVPLLVGNRQLLQRILLSFGDNALHYGSATQPVHLSITGHGDRVRIGVRDYGPAVPSDMWQRLDGRVARRAQAPLGNRPHTSGVGLIAAKRLAELMDSVVGTIRHHDGATFYIDLRVSGQMSLL
jgi:K+-sensing histidine kinase KdpD